jgi:transcriptional regulator with XRE-family HTH domain
MTLLAESVKTHLHDELQQKFAVAVRAQRHSLGLSLTDVSERTEMKKAYLSWIENGNANVTLKTVARLAEALEISPASLIK